MIEEWKLIHTILVNNKYSHKGDKYYVSNLGRCKINDNIVNPRINNGYCVFRGFLHRIVYESFIGIIPKGYEIDHIDGNRTNNCIDNLRLVTHKENCNNPISLSRNKGYMNMGWDKLKKQHQYLSSLRKGSKLVVGEDGKRHWKYF